MGIKKQSSIRLVKPDEKIPFLGGGGPPRTIEERLDMLEAFAQESMQVVNNQGEGLKSISSRIGEFAFKLGKMEETQQLQRIGIRVQRDKLHTYMKTLCSLGIIDDEIMQVAYDIMESRYLPITSEGKVNGGVFVSRYNPPEGMPIPRGASE